MLPWCESLLEFYDQHFAKYSNGTLFLQHAQSCETWPDCDNPAAQVAALIRIAEGLNAIPKSLLSTEQAAFFSRIAKSLPAIPLTTDPEDGLLQVRKNAFFSRCFVLKMIILCQDRLGTNKEKVQTKTLLLQVAPCESGFPAHHVNSENVETYAIWPYEFFAVNRSAEVEAAYPLAVGQATFKNVHFGHGNSAWRYDGQDAALLGMANYSWEFARARVLSQVRKHTPSHEKRSFAKTGSRQRSLSQNGCGFAGVL